MTAREVTTSREIAEENLILLCTVGSSAHGLALPGSDDHDELGVCIEPPGYVIGLKLFEQDVYRSKPQGVRSEHGDTDRTIYSLRKFCRLALGGNPSILAMLYAEPSQISRWGEGLLGLRYAFSARKAGNAFLGYATQQRQRLLGERGQMNVKRPELVAAHGFDTKYAMHMLRLGYQGVEFLETGQLTLPMPPEEREFVYATRKGEVELNEVLTKAGELERKLEDLLTTSPLPEQPDSERVNAWLVETYQDHWEWNG
jgi:predicted nucleotidyltransferase